MNSILVTTVLTVVALGAPLTAMHHGDDISAVPTLSQGTTAPVPDGPPSDFKRVSAPSQPLAADLPIPQWSEIRAQVTSWMVPRGSAHSVPRECGCCYEEELGGGVYQHQMFEGSICVGGGEERTPEPHGYHPDVPMSGNCATTHFPCGLGGGDEFVAHVTDLLAEKDYEAVERLVAGHPSRVLLDTVEGAVLVLSCAGTQVLAKVPFDLRAGRAAAHER